MKKLAIPQINDICLLHSDRTGQLLLMIEFFMVVEEYNRLFKTLSNAS